MPIICHNKRATFALMAFVLFCSAACTNSLKLGSSEFNNANDFTEMRANVVLADNKIVFGYLSVNNTVNNGFAKIRMPKNRVNVEIPIANIKAYTIEDKEYFLKEINPATTKYYVWGKPSPKKCFVQKLTPAEFPFHLYTSEEKVKDTKSSLTSSIKHYYLEVDGGHTLIDVNDKEIANLYHKEIAKMCTSKPTFAAQYQPFKKEFDKTILHRGAEEKIKVLLKLGRLFANSTV